MDVEKVARKVLRESRFTEIREGLSKLEQAHFELVLAARNNEENCRAALERRIYTIIQGLKERADRPG